MSRADLHMHSTASDGGYTPSELVRKCYHANLSIISLTDHDTTNGIMEAKEEASKWGITVISGIELSTKACGKSVHILGYGIDVEDPTLEKKLEEQREMREARMQVMLTKLAKEDIPLKAKDVLKYVDGGSIGRPHVAKAIVEQGYVKDVGEAFDRYLAEGKPCYVEKAREFTPQEAIQCIHDAGGVAVIAHPVYYELDHKIEEWMMKDGLDGVEIYHRDHTSRDIMHYESVVDKWEQMAGKSLIKTGGSDFHHETYGRKTEPLGHTTVPLSLAKNLINIIHS